MKKTIKITTTEYITVEFNDVIAVDTSYDGDYYPWNDQKWIDFCKKHGFDHRITNGKTFDLYLRLCAERMV